MINASDKRIMLNRRKSGNSVWRVINPSMNPAITKTGTVPTIIYSPFLAPRIKDSLRE